MYYIKIITSLFLILTYIAPITISASEFFTHFEICESDCGCCSESTQETSCCVEECTYEVHEVPEIPIVFTAISKIIFNSGFKIINQDLILNSVENFNKDEILFKSFLDNIDIRYKKIYLSLISSQYYSSDLI